MMQDLCYERAECVKGVSSVDSRRKHGSAEPQRHGAKELLYEIELIVT